MINTNPVITQLVIKTITDNDDTVNTAMTMIQIQLSVLKIY